MSKSKIFFSSSDDSFVPAEREKNWIDSSFSGADNPVGSYRMPAVSNGGYESKHPILDKTGNTIGFISNGAADLGYTYQCVCANDRFWITHQTFYAMRNHGNSRVSIVEEKRKSIFSSSRRFRVVKSFEFGDSWLGADPMAFKLLDSERKLLYLTQQGFCLFDTSLCSEVAKAEYNDITYCIQDFNISPDFKFLALAVSKERETDRNLYDNFIRLYNLKTGSKLNDIFLDVDESMGWDINFSEDSRQLRASSRFSRLPSFHFKIRSS